VLKHDLTNRTEARRVFGHSPRKHVGEITEELRSAKAPSADHYTVTTRFTHHAQSIPGFPDVPVAKNRDMVHTSFEVGDGVPVRFTGVAFGCGTGMKSDGCTAFFLADSTCVAVGGDIFVDPHPEFDGDRHRVCRTNGGSNERVAE
jgi:hypothetical protein